MMPAENLAGLAAKLCFPSLRLVWGVRSSFLDFAHYDLFTRLVYRVEALLSRFPDLVIANSRAGADSRISKGFPREKVRVVWNGIDCNRFAPDHSAGEQMRRRWGVRDDRLVIGMVGRLDPMKDHFTFLRAAKTLALTRDIFEFVCVGGGGQPSHADQLSALDGELQEQGKLHWIPFEDNMPAVYNGLNLLVLCSAFGEGFPNVIGEAMACGIPCVVTDVGDSATLVGDAGWIIPSRDPEALATAVERALQEMQQRDVGADARERALAEFGLGRFLAETERVLSPLVGNHESH
jgi:glycosyltransferase involved in cell wall biosynthesis